MAVSVIREPAFIYRALRPGVPPSRLYGRLPVGKQLFVLNRTRNGCSLISGLERATSLRALMDFAENSLICRSCSKHLRDPRFVFLTCPQNPYLSI